MKAVLHVISDRQRHRLPLLKALLEAARGGADVLQVREKKAPAQEIYQFCSELTEACMRENISVQVLVNDRVDVALASHSAGVHLAGKSLPVSAVRSLFKRAHYPGLVGCSVHSYDAAKEAEKAGADYITFGHVFASESHRGQPPRGVYELARIVDDVDVPVIAIGGIDRDNVLPVLETGCSGIAVIGAVLDQDSPCDAALRIREQMERCGVLPKVPFPLQRERKKEIQR
ncbi:thiamine phosphate synthase [Alicyclobacillus tolerans]|uniref:thiamine phosphate synthase n=1 Tax=Alicyclobacillus tolerans TaxID=90970 RepID=UPI001F3F9A42|nr:thiamine phosphate synthase [Alicyclobacillus tolerans]MCF8564023.1 thiamine phosphate synthase [Alicyclobacillus tolerans]